jgi:two-component system, OmpR family, response regulator ArlR
MKILVVENEDSIRDLLKMWFDLETKYETILVGNCDDANLYLDRETPDLIILDYYLGDCTAQTILSHLNSLNNHISPKIILCSALMNIEEYCSRNKIDDFIKKPYTFEEMMEKINQIKI